MLLDHEGLFYHLYSMDLKNFLLKELRVQLIGPQEKHILYGTNGVMTPIVEAHVTHPLRDMCSLCTDTQ